ncbi:MAG: hypothetical protein Q4G58_11465 [bacterium]|nr:hypothetical protein [bacterium]
MNEQYKDDMKQLHAPNDLKEDTIHKKQIAGIAITVIVIAVAMAIAISKVHPTKAHVYNMIVNEQINGDLVGTDKPDMSKEEYSNYLGMNVMELIKGETPSNYTIQVTNSKKGKIAEKDKGIFYYNVNGDMLRIELSKTEELAPKGLLQGTASKLDGKDVYLGKYEGRQQICATGKINQVSYLIVGEMMEAEQFEKIVTRFLEGK